MSTDIAVRDGDDWAQLAKVANTIANTEFVPKGLRGNKPAIMACLLYGRDLGLQPMVALREITMIDGTPSMSAALVTARVREAGHRMWWDNIDDGQGRVLGVTAHGRRTDTGDTGEFTFTLEMAKQAGLVRDKSPWVKYPQSMCWARAATQLARMLFSDVFLGHAVYTPEEFGGEPEEADLEAVVSEEDVSGGNGASTPGEVEPPSAAPSPAAATHSEEPKARVGDTSEPAPRVSSPAQGEAASSEHSADKPLFEIPEAAKPKRAA